MNRSFIQPSQTGAKGEIRKPGPRSGSGLCGDCEWMEMCYGGSILEHQGGWWWGSTVGCASTVRYSAVSNTGCIFRMWLYRYGWMYGQGYGVVYSTTRLYIYLSRYSILRTLYSKVWSTGIPELSWTAIEIELSLSNCDLHWAGTPSRELLLLCLIRFIGAMHAPRSCNLSSMIERFWNTGLCWITRITHYRYS